MSWSERRRFLALAAALAVSGGCGFTPVYAPGGDAAAARGRLRIGDIDGLVGFTLRERLLSRLGAPASPTHVLDVKVSIEKEGLAIAPDADITRFNLTGTASYSIRRIGESQPLLSDRVQSFAAYNSTASPYATRVSARDARARLAQVLADMIAARVAATAGRWMK